MIIPSRNPLRRLLEHAVRALAGQPRPPAQRRVRRARREGGTRAPRHRARTHRPRRARAVGAAEACVLRPALARRHGRRGHRSAARRSCRPAPPACACCSPPRRKSKPAWPSVALAITCDRTSNGPHLYYPNPTRPGRHRRARRLGAWTTSAATRSGGTRCSRPPRTWRADARHHHRRAARGRAAARGAVPRGARRRLGVPQALHDAAVRGADRESSQDAGDARRATKASTTRRRKASRSSSRCWRAAPSPSARRRIRPTATRPSSSPRPSARPNCRRNPKIAVRLLGFGQARVPLARHARGHRARGAARARAGRARDRAHRRDQDAQPVRAERPLFSRGRRASTWRR